MQGILEKVFEHVVHALIDAGTCIAGISYWQGVKAINDVARYHCSHWQCENDERRRLLGVVDFAEIPLRDVGLVSSRMFRRKPFR